MHFMIEYVTDPAACTALAETLYRYVQCDPQYRWQWQQDVLIDRPQRMVKYESLLRTHVVSEDSHVLRAVSGHTTVGFIVWKTPEASALQQTQQRKDGAPHSQSALSRLRYDMHRHYFDPVADKPFVWLQHMAADSPEILAQLVRACCSQLAHDMAILVQSQARQESLEVFKALGFRPLGVEFFDPGGFTLYLLYKQGRFATI